MKVASCDPGMNADLWQAYLFQMGFLFLTGASQNAVAFFFFPKNFSIYLQPWYSWTALVDLRLFLQLLSVKSDIKLVNTPLINLQTPKLNEEDKHKL